MKYITPLIIRTKKRDVHIFAGRTWSPALWFVLTMAIVSVGNAIPS